jgi:hypothetical protein
MVLLSALADGPASPECEPELFRIARSTNANVVDYEARLAAPGSLDKREPVHASWIMLAADGHREELNFVEQGLAYGFDVSEASARGTFELKLRAQPERRIAVRFRDGCPTAFMTITGRETILRRIYVEVGGGLFPEVRSVELVGLGPEDGAEVREIVPAS